MSRASDPAASDLVAARPRCPLCRAEGGMHVASLPYEQVWARLREEWGAQFSADTRRRHTPAAAVTLLRCAECGLDYFFPAVPGDAGFYAELMNAVPYEEDRWEFAVVSQLVDGSESLVDFGSGKGAFLRQLGARAGRAVGLDYNGEAIEAMTAAGLEAHGADFDSFAAKEGRAVDVACAFQLIEHLGDVEALMRPMIQCTKPGGRLFVSLPNRDRHGASPADPLDCPPHHASRWSAVQLMTLADRFSLTLAGIRFSPLTYSEAAELCLARLDRLLPSMRARSRSATVLRGLARRALIGPRRYGLAARAGVFEKYGRHGHTMLAELRVPHVRGRA